MTYTLDVSVFLGIRTKSTQAFSKETQKATDCVIWIPFTSESKMGHYISCFREENRSLKYRDPFWDLNDFALSDICCKIDCINKVKYQSIFTNDCRFLSLLHLYLKINLDPIILKEYRRKIIHDSLLSFIVFTSESFFTLF